MKKFRTAVLGATGLVGRELLRLLEDHNVVLGEPVLAAGENSAGDIIPFKNEEIPVRPLADVDFSKVELVFSTLPKAVATSVLPQAARMGCYVIDCSGAASAAEALRIVPEVNINHLKAVKNGGLIASPEPASIQLALALNALSKTVTVRSITTTVLYATGRGGVRAMDELYNQSIGLLGGAGAEEMDGHVFPTQIGFNCLPTVGNSSDGSQNDIEAAIKDDLKNLFGLEHVHVTGITIPSFVGCSQAVTLQVDKHLLPQDVRALLESQSGLAVIDDLSNNAFSTPFGAAETDPVYVSRVRTGKDTIELWLSSDNLRKGSALNLVQIAENLAAQIA